MDVPPPLSWRAGSGWLVLLGGSSGLWRATEAIDRAAIDALGRDGPIAFVPAAQCPPDYGETFLAHYAELGAPPGYVVPVHDQASARDPENVRLLAQAGLIYIGGGETPALLEAMTGSPALDAIALAHAEGAVVVGMSAGAIALAAWGVSIDPDVGLLQGWSWLVNAVVAPHYTPERAAALDGALAQQPHALGIGIPEHTALALGPDGLMRAWGDGDIAFTPGPKASY